MAATGTALARLPLLRLHVEWRPGPRQPGQLAGLDPGLLPPGGDVSGINGYAESHGRRRRWWEPKMPVCPDMLFDRTGYRVEVRECGAPLSVDPIEDPFIHAEVVVCGWRAALAVLLGRYSVEVLVGADKATVETVLELNPEYLGAPESERRQAWNAQLNRALATFVDEDPE